MGQSPALAATPQSSMNESATNPARCVLNLTFKATPRATPSRYHPIVPVLVLLSAGPSGRVERVLPLSQPVNVLGRAADVDIPLIHDSISRQHAQVLEGPDGWIAKSLNPQNPLRVSGRNIDALALTDGVEFEIGPLRVQFRLEDPREKATVVGSSPPPRQTANPGQQELVLDSVRPAAPTRRPSTVPWVLGLLGFIIGAGVLVTHDSLAALLWEQWPDAAQWLGG